MRGEPVQHALTCWGLDRAQAALAARRENTVWRVEHDGAAYALRFHRPGYRTKQDLRSELDWMMYLARGGVRVPEPIPTTDGDLIATVGGHHVSLLTWLEGRPIGAIGQLHDIADPVALCRRLGGDMARLHDLTDAWMPPSGFTRPDWRRDGLLGNHPLWGRFWDHPRLKADQRDLLMRVRDLAQRDLTAVEATADQGLIHADLLAENILIQGDDLSFIDFDDGAFGFRDFELATFLLKFIGHPDYPKMRVALCDGYALRRRVNDRELDLFLLLRALTYPGWIMERLDEPGADQRSTRALNTALSMADDYLRRRQL
jgi:Ser/Thr protein kinase RdoA (MazF antagonist)